MKRFKGWLRKLIIICIIIILAGIAMSIFMMLESFSSTISAGTVEDYKQSEDEESEPLVINIPTPCNKGHITVQDEEGATHFQYGGYIVIENDGKDGNPIEIYVYVDSNDPAYDLE